MQDELVALDVPPGSGYDSQSGLNNLFPKVFGRLAAEGCGRRVAFIVIHPTSNFMGHYLIAPLQRRGRAILALNTRYVANDSALIMERAIQDLGAGVQFLRQRGYERIVLCGNSGGGSLAAFYQAEAENLTVTTTPDGMPFTLRPEQIPPVDGLAMLAAHPGRAATMVEWIDPSVVDERDMYATDSSLDMYTAANGPPYDAAWLHRYRASQRARNDRITDWVLERLAALNADPDTELIKDAPFIVYRHSGRSALPRFGAGSERSGCGAQQASELWADQSGSILYVAVVPEPMERATVARGWSVVHGALLGAGAECDVLSGHAGVSGAVPVVVGGCRVAMHDHTLKGATHFLLEQDALIEELADLLVSWADGL